MIIAYVGLQGSGKTTALMRFVLKRFRAEACQVFSDIASLHIPRATYIDAEEPRQLATISQGVFAFDEAQVVADARFWQKVPAEVLSSWSQLRKNGVDVCYTTQVFESVDARLRGMTGEVWNCARIGPTFVMRRTVPGTKKVISTRAALASKDIWKLYDSWEVVGKRVGEGAGRCDVLEQIRARRAERTPRSKRVKPHPFAAHAFRWYDGRCRVTSEAQRVKAWLVEKGHVRPGDEAMWDKVEAELRRKRWLRYCGIRGDEYEAMPYVTTYEDPWLTGWSPSSVKARVEIEQKYQAWEKEQAEIQKKVIAGQVRQEVNRRAKEYKESVYVD